MKILFISFLIAFNSMASAKTLSEYTLQRSLCDELKKDILDKKPELVLLKDLEKIDSAFGPEDSQKIIDLIKQIQVQQEYTDALIVTTPSCSAQRETAYKQVVSAYAKSSPTDKTAIENSFKNKYAQSRVSLKILSEVKLDISILTLLSQNKIGLFKNLSEAQLADLELDLKNDKSTLAQGYQKRPSLIKLAALLSKELEMSQKIQSKWVADLAHE